MGKITVDAKLRYQNVNKVNLTTTIKYSDWKMLSLAKMYSMIIMI